MKKLSFAMLAIMFFACNFVSCRNNGQIMQKWAEENALKEFSMNSKELDKLNLLSNKKYYLDSLGNISIKEEEYINVHNFAYGNGIFTGTSHGEFDGGKLIYKDENIEYTIIEDNIHEILNFKDDIYVLTGVSHGFTSIGSIIKLKLLDGKWAIDSEKKINSCPVAYTIYEDTLYIATARGLATYDGMEVKNLLENQKWHGLYAETIYVNDEIVAIGLRGCVAVMNRKDNKVKYYR